MPVSFVFDRLIDDVSRKVSRSIAYDEIEADPINGPTIVDKAVKETFGELSTRDRLAILASIEDLDDVWIDTRPIEGEAQVSHVVSRCLNAMIEFRLGGLRKQVYAVSFAAGFPATADELVSLAERAVETYPATKIFSQEAVVEAREILDRLVTKSATAQDIRDLASFPMLFHHLLKSPKDNATHQRHGMDYETISDVTGRYKRFVELLGYAQMDAEIALTAISNRADSELNAKKQVSPNVVKP